MNGRRLAVLALTALLACSSPAATRRPDLRSTGSEAPPAVTVPGGRETLPVWRHTPDGTATLVVPADLLFAKDSAALSPAASAVLEQVVREFRPGTHVLVEGHADSDGSESYNQALSERRADAVAGWLAAQGIPPAALEATGLGESRPAVEETDEAAKAKNRRVVVTLTPAARSATAVKAAPAPLLTHHTPGRLRAGRASPSDDPPNQRRTS